ncbi:hypothetical protein SLEP1_g9327 [Rubroshorea leprosula]|uniref:Pentatricopeptide repeat-containing protein n=1 Tax=Rubroshorea leprosula TaxID=152421 RepID=A0AAV5ICZ3_9ROSI|nr:hypothetical protein SLEP1_g9327 [Rubroshorea leprosula]
MEVISLPNSKTVTFANQFMFKLNRKNGNVCPTPSLPPTSVLRILRPLLRATKSAVKLQFLSQPLEITSDAAIPTSGKHMKTATASDVLHLLDSLSLRVPSDIYTSLIKECTAIRDSAGALQLHAHIKRSRLKPTLNLINRLLLMHVSCGHLETARQLFDQMTLKDFNSWANMIVAYIDTGEYEEGIALFVQMQNYISMLKFPAWIVVCILKVCVLTRNVALGKQVHGQLLKLGATDNLFLSGSIINFYGRLKCLDDARSVFDQLSCRNTVIWTEKIVNSCREGQFVEAIHDFNEMSREGIKRDSFTFSSVLKACSQLHDDGKCGCQVHASAIKLGLEFDAFVQCGLIDMYGKCGLLPDAEREFEAVCDKKNSACWNAMLMGYVHNGVCVEAIKFLYKMKEVGIKVQESLVDEVRIACSSSTLTRELGKQTDRCTAEE